MQWLNDLSVRNKISGNSLLLILLMLGSTLYAINSMRSIGSELEAIAEQDIPMTEVLTRITEHQLEQAIHFERAVRYAILLNRDDKAEEHFVKEVNYFNKLNAKVDKEILEGEDHAAKAIENAHTDLEEQEFTRILAALKKIEAEHKEFAKHAGEAFTLYRTGRLAEKPGGPHGNNDRHRKYHQQNSQRFFFMQFRILSRLKGEQFNLF